MSNLPTNAEFQILRSQQIRGNVHFVMFKNNDGIYSTGTLVDIPKQESTAGGWYLFGEQKFAKERAAVIAYNKLCQGVPVKLK
ncbi:hypothetical protein [Trichormus variabilis]|uniref:Uncharacterized protein n=1 Tax=Trichormus variabilis SAG 1403-4b TaxID=447716 RepID=A0A433UG93_ANAVA|nr:hypothetical protein [Trichormus variabilis]RUS92903.1 hypothetical protein DSM107003_46500 [Trichormus variabilis SAG 1403-4b]